MSAATDTRQAYAAEHMLRDILSRQYQAPAFKIGNSTIAVPIERKFADLPSMQRYVSAVLPGEGVTVRERKGQSIAHYFAPDREIAIPVLRTDKGRSPWAMREAVLLHECAHHRTGHGHGPVFQERYIALLTEHMSPEAGLLMRVLLHEHA